jgi:hypothetical protein
MNRGVIEGRGRGRPRGGAGRAGAPSGASAHFGASCGRLKWGPPHPLAEARHAPHPLPPRGSGASAARDGVWRGGLAPDEWVGGWARRVQLGSDGAGRALSDTRGRPLRRAQPSPIRDRPDPPLRRAQSSPHRVEERRALTRHPVGPQPRQVQALAQEGGRRPGQRGWGGPYFKRPTDAPKWGRHPRERQRDRPRRPGCRPPSLTITPPKPSP